MRDFVVVLEAPALRLTAQDGCVVLLDPDLPDNRFVWTRGQAVLLAKMVRSFNLDLSLALRKAADYCTDMSAGGEDIVG